MWPFKSKDPAQLVAEAAVKQNKERLKRLAGIIEDGLDRLGVKQQVRPKDLAVDGGYQFPPWILYGEDEDEWSGLSVKMTCERCKETKREHVSHLEDLDSTLCFDCRYSHVPGPRPTIPKELRPVLRGGAPPRYRIEG